MGADQQIPVTIDNGMAMKENASVLNGKTEKESWGYVKKRARLDDEEVWMAKRLGKTPMAVLRMVPSESEAWKDPAALFIRRLYSKRFGSGYYEELRAKKQDARKRYLMKQEKQRNAAKKG